MVGAELYRRRNKKRVTMEIKGWWSKPSQAFEGRSVYSAAAICEHLPLAQHHRPAMHSSARQPPAGSDTRKSTLTTPPSQALPPFRTSGPLGSFRYTRRRDSGTFGRDFAEAEASSTRTPM